MTELEFVVSDPSSPAWRSPLSQVLVRAPEWIRDVSALVDDAAVAALGPAAGIAGIELEGAPAPQLLRRLTDLALDELPAVGPVAHVRTLVVGEAGDRYRLWFPQEYSDYMAEVVIDTAEGL